MRSFAWSLRSTSLLFGLLIVASSAHADERADALLRDVERSTHALSSLGARMQVTMTTQNFSARPDPSAQSRPNDSGFGVGNEPVSFTYCGTVKLQHPNLERIQLLAPIHQTIACDGESLWTLLQTNEFIKNPADPHGKSPTSYGPILMFFAPETARTAGVLPTGTSLNPEDFATRYLGKERVVLKVARSKEDTSVLPSETTPEEFDVVEVRQLRPTQQSMKLYINSDKIVTRVVSETRRGGISTIQDVSLLNLKPFQKFDPSEFAFALPENARPYEFKPVPVRQ